MVEIKTRPDQPASMSERINKRLRNSGGEEGSMVTKTGDGAQRVFHNIHDRGNVHQRGPDNKGEGDIVGRPRGSNNPRGEI